MQTQDEQAIKDREQPGYFQVAGVHLFAVLHEVADPLARVLLVGPFAAERHNSYTAWVRWARYLAARRIECLRYDYRGIGESTGTFHEMSFPQWIEDAEILAAWLQRRLPGRPLVVHGLELGALLAGKAFSEGIGDALLMWSPPDSAHDVLRASIMRRMAIDNMFNYGVKRRVLADYVEQIESGTLEVDGYRWSSRLWRDGFHLRLPAEAGEAGSTNFRGKRPVRTLRLEKSAEPLVNGTACVSINPDLGALFADNFEWITTALAINSGGANGRGH